MAGSTTFNQGMSIAVARAFLGEVPLGPQSGNFSIDWSAGNYQSVVLGASGLTITAPAVGVGLFQLKITQDATGGRTLPTFVPAINWIGGAPVLPVGAGSVDLIQLYCDGANFFGTSLAASNPLELPTLIIGDPGTEAGGITVAGTLYNSVLKTSDLGGTNAAEMIIHRHSTTIEAVLVGSRSNSDTAAHANVTAGQNLFSIFGVGWAGADYKQFGSVNIAADTSGVISNTSSPGKWIFNVTPTGSVVPVPWLTVTNDSKAAFAGNLTAAGQGPYAFGSVINPTDYFLLAGTFTSTTLAVGLDITTVVNPTAGQAYGILAEMTLNPSANNFGSMATVAGIINKAGAGTHTDFIGLDVLPPQIGAGAAILTNATTLKIEGAPVVGNNKRSLWVIGGLSQFDGPITLAGGQLLATSAALTNNAAAAAGTLANAPVAGNPTKWIPINDNGTIRNIPAW